MYIEKDMFDFNSKYLRSIPTESLEYYRIMTAFISLTKMIGLMKIFIDINNFVNYLLFL